MDAFIHFYVTEPRRNGCWLLFFPPFYLMLLVLNNYLDLMHGHEKSQLNSDLTFSFMLHGHIPSWTID